MYATAWHNGGPPEDPAGYGLRLTKADRDRYFDSTWEEVVLEMDGAPAASIPLSASFWRSCSELRSATIGHWLLSTDAAPWAQGRPPGIAVTPIEGNQFSARLLQRRALQQ